MCYVLSFSIWTTKTIVTIVIILFELNVYQHLYKMF